MSLLFRVRRAARRMLRRQTPEPDLSVHPNTPERIAALAAVNARQAVGRVDPHALPPGATAVELRDLPYPFRNWFTIGNDCDASVLEVVEASVHLNRRVRETIGLPIADSFFAKWLYEEGLSQRREAADGPVGGTFDPARFARRVGGWLRGFHEGWFDSVHGWVHNMSTRIAPSFTLEVAADGATAIHAPEFGPHPRWQDPNVPRYLCFRCAPAPTGLAFGVTGTNAGTRVMEVRPVPPADDGGLVIIDLLEAVGGSPGPLPGMTLEFQLEGPPGTTVEVTDLLLVTDTRAVIDAQARALAQLNVRVNTFSTHGGGLTFAIRPRAALDFEDERFASDAEASPHRADDLLLAHGFEFIHTFTTTRDLELVHVDDIAEANVTRSGLVVWDFHRYGYTPTSAEYDGPPAQLGLADHGGLQIRGALSRRHDRPGLGGILYTHLMFSTAEHPLARGPSHAHALNEDTANALAELRDLHFNGSGTVPPAERVYVAPTSVMVRLSQMRREVRHRAWYDASANTIHVRSWTDAITGRRVPSAERGFRELRSLPFYVDDARTARILVDEVEVPALLRAPADDTGRESVSVVDVSAPRVILGRVPLRDTSLAAHLDGIEIDGGDGTGNRFELRAATGIVELRLPDVSAANMQHVAIAYRKTSPSLRFRLELVLERGVVLEIPDPRVDGTAPRVEAHALWRLIEAAAPGPEAAPVGRVEALRLHLEGRAGDALDVAHVHLLRDDERPQSEAGCVVGGYLGDAAAGVRMTYGGATHEAVVADDGCYFFLERVPRGAIVDVEARAADGSIRHPLNGPRVEILTDTVNVDFVHFDA